MGGRGSNCLTIIIDTIVLWKEKRKIHPVECHHKLREYKPKHTQQQLKGRSPQHTKIPM